LARLIAGVEDEKAKVRVVKIADGFHQRAAFETDKDPERQKDQAVRKVRFNGCSRRPSEAPSARAAFQPPGS
jgi:phage-related protein